MDRLELVVGDCDLDQRGHHGLGIMQELFKVAHQLWHMIVVWGHEDGVLQAHPDPVLADAEFAGPLGLAAHPVE